VETNNLEDVMTINSNPHTLIHFHAPLWLQQAAKFLAVGLLNTGLDWAIYFAFTCLIPFFANQPTAAKAISYSIAILNSYLLNREWTFKSRSNPWATLFPFLACSFAGLVINATVMHLSLHSLLLSEMVALVLATGTTILWNFFTSKFLVFRK
jgi:putative flippase GtrA